MKMHTPFADDGRRGGGEARAELIALGCNAPVVARAALQIGRREGRLGQIRGDDTPGRRHGVEAHVVAERAGHGAPAHHWSGRRIGRAVGRRSQLWRCHRNACVNRADAIVRRVGDEHVPAAVDHHAAQLEWEVQLRVFCRTVVAGEIGVDVVRRPASGDGRDNPAARVDLANTRRVVISDVEVAVARIDRHVRRLDVGLQRRTTVAEWRGQVVMSGDRSDRSVLRHFADGVVEVVGNEDIARFVGDRVDGVREGGGRRRPSVTRKPLGPRSRKRRDHVRLSVDAPHFVPGRLGDVEEIPHALSNFAEVAERPSLLPAGGSPPPA